MADQPDAGPELLATIYRELRAVAEHRLGNERAGHTLQATALVHEAWMRLSANGPAQWTDKRQFFGAAAEAMRRVLIDHARGKARQKRGGDARPGGGLARKVPLDVLDLAEERDPLEILALEEALCRLEALDAEAFSVVRLRFFAGLTGDEAAEVLDISPRQVDRAWAFARAWLQRDLSPDTRNEP